MVIVAKSTTIVHPNPSNPGNRKLSGLRISRQSVWWGQERCEMRSSSNAGRPSPIAAQDTQTDSRSKEYVGPSFCSRIMKR